MKSEEILELVRAGFTKEEISKMDSNSMEVGNEPPAQPTEDSENEKEVLDNKAEAKASTVTLSEDQFKQLMQGVAVKTASGSIEVPPSIDNKLAERFKSICKGEM